MFLISKSCKKFLAAIAAILLSSPVWAAGPPVESPLYNPLAMLLFTLMIILLIVIGILGSVLTGAADITLLKQKKLKEAAKKQVLTRAVALCAVCLLTGSALFAQDGTVASTAQATGIGGLSASVFYVMISIIFLELLVILVLLVNVRLLIKSEKEKITVVAVQEVVAKKQQISWWARFNKLKPLEQEGDLDLGHDYDGIRELNNRLPPWWIYGFYVTIIFAAIYLWRFHVAHSAPLSKQEYELAVQKADQKVRDYLKLKGESVDENTVAMLGASDIAAGQKIFSDPSKCAACHGANASGMVNGNPGIGPNLTDDYWLHNGDIKSIFKTIKYGVDGKGMPEWKSTFSAKQIAQLASFIKSLKGSNPALAKPPQGELFKEQQTQTGTSADSSVTKKSNKIAAR